ncbi:hypothetical protein L195_g051832, partial [Trifolium pratense]
RGRKDRGDVAESFSRAQHVDKFEAEYNDEISPPPPTRNPRAQNPPPRAPDDEGFDGGPTDLTLLPTFENHIDATLGEEK